MLEQIFPHLHIFYGIFARAKWDRVQTYAAIIRFPFRKKLFP